jgi:tRNA pseudouridine38-40 synthase
MVAPTVPDDGLTRIRLLVAYEGSAFHGVAPQPGQATVGGELVALATRVLRQAVDPTLVVAGRTDAGVHAWGQVVHLDVGGAPTGADLERLRRSSVKLLGPAISVRRADLAPAGFDARFSARWRRYRYVVDTRPVGDPFTTGTAWRVGVPLDLDAMRLAADAVLGEHDFAAFCRAPDAPGATTVRTVLDTRWEALGGGLVRFEITATAFCQNMVRSLVGHLVEVGRGRRRAGDVLGVLRSGDRRRAGPVAPPHGLCLLEVGYPDGWSMDDGHADWSQLPHMFLTSAGDTRRRRIPSDPSRPW